MDLNQLRTFVAVAQEGNLTRAAQKINLSQPAVSTQIKTLEEELGLQLFNRTGHGMSLTSEGERILIDAERALTAARGIAKTARQLQGNVIDTFRLGTISDPAILRLADTLGYLTRTFPNVRLAITHGISGEIVTGVVSDRLDAGYVIGPVSNPQLRTERVTRIALKVTAPARLSKQLRAARNLSDLIELPWISTPKNCSFHHIMKRVFERADLVPNIVVEADYENTMTSLVASGVGLSLLREDVAKRVAASGEVEIWDGLTEYADLNFVYPAACGERPTIRAFLSTLQAVWFDDPIRNEENLPHPTEGEANLIHLSVSWPEPVPQRVSQS